MMNTSQMEWMARQLRLERAGQCADEIVEISHGLSAPVQPLEIAQSETPLLHVIGNNFRDYFDGRLEYHPSQARFLLFFNTKYDAGRQGEHHPRTRFSIAHELGHYFLEDHRAYLMRGGAPHASASEYASRMQVEREADSFAACLLMPTKAIRPKVNAAELSLARLEEIAAVFRTSMLSTAIRSVRLSDFPCAVAGVRDAAIAWMFASEALVKGGCYPVGRGDLSAGAQQRWEAFASGDFNRAERNGKVDDWLRTYERDDLAAIPVWEEYLPIASTETLVVLLSVDECDLFQEEDE